MNTPQQPPQLGMFSKAFICLLTISAILAPFVIDKNNQIIIKKIFEKRINHPVPEQNASITIGLWRGTLNNKPATLEFTNITNDTRVEATINNTQKLEGIIRGNRLVLKNAENVYSGTFDITATVYKGDNFNFELSKAIIRNNTQFSNITVDPYWIDNNDNLYYIERVGWGGNSKKVVVMKNTKAVYGQKNNTYFAIQNDGSLWAWGKNEYGQVGDNTGINRDAPVKVLDNVKDLAYRENSYVFALKNDGTVYAWGAKSNSQQKKYAPEKLEIENVLLFNYDTYLITKSGDMYQLEIVQKPSKSGKYVNGYSHRINIKHGNRTTTWNLNSDGKLYDANNKLFASNVAFVEYSDRNMWSYISKNGELYNWGDVTGNGTNIPQERPVQVLYPKKIRQIKGRCALSFDGELYAIDNDKTFKYRLIATNVAILSDLNGLSFHTNNGDIYNIDNFGKILPNSRNGEALPKIKGAGGNSYKADMEILPIQEETHTANTPEKQVQTEEKLNTEQKEETNTANTQEKQVQTEVKRNTEQKEDYTARLESALSNAINAFDDGRYSDAFKFYSDAAAYPTNHSTSIKQNAAKKFKEKAERIIANNNGECDDLTKQLLQYASKLYPSSEIQSLLNKCGSISGATSSNSYRFPQASERLLSASDLSGLSKYDLKIMRNEIFARHGYVFQTKDMKNYFQNQSWYTPRYSNVTSMLTSIEQKNIAMIKRYE